MLFLSILWGCIDPPKELPPSRIVSASTGSMIQFGDLRGFLVTRGEIHSTLLWKVDRITAQHKQCALQQVPANTKALLIDHHIELAQTYLSTSSPPSPLVCPP